MKIKSWKEISHTWADVEKTYQKSDLAKQQLHTAIMLFLNRIDFASAITLAGASGEILHKLLEFNGKRPFLEHARILCDQIIGHIPKKQKYIKHFRDITGIYPLRHKDKNCPDILEIDLEAAAERAISAAVLDYIKLYGEEEPTIKSFLNWLWVTKDGQKMMDTYEALPEKVKKNAFRET